MIIKRINKINYYIENQKSCLVLGPRGTGKTFYLKQLLSTCDNFFFINLLNAVELKKYLTCPEILYLEIEENLKKNDKLIVCIDEIQKEVGLFDQCHRIIEDFPLKVTMILTGSSARKLKKNRTNLLAARALLVKFSTFSFEEVDLTKNLNTVLQYGLLPMSYTEKKDDLKIDYLKTYVAVYLKEEIINEALTRKVDVFNHFLELAAQYNGQPLTYSKLAKQLHIDERTLKSHYEILEDTMLIHTIKAWTSSTKKRLQKASKHYFFDNGVLNALKGELKTELKEHSFRYGHLFENFIINEIIKLNSLLGDEYNLYHYRTDSGQEIDLILQKNAFSPPVAIEIKSSATPDPSGMPSLKHFSKEFPAAKIVCVCNADRPYEKDNIKFYPFQLFLEQLKADLLA